MYNFSCGHRSQREDGDRLERVILTTGGVRQTHRHIDIERKKKKKKGQTESSRRQTHPLVHSLRHIWSLKRFGF